MVGEIGKDVITAPTIVELPRYTTETFKRFVDLTPDDYRENGQAAGWAKEILDTTNIWWRTINKTQEGLSRYKSAFTLFGLPRLESRQARQGYEEAQDITNKIIWGIDLFLHSSKPSWDKVGEIAETVGSWNERKKEDGQIVALCEAISETNNLGLSENEIRQKIAQHAWDELMAIFPYAKVRDETLTTRDELETEKQELKTAIEGPLWDIDDRKKAGVDFRKYKGQMRKGEYELTLRRAFKFLYECAKGNIPQKKSAIDILRAQEEIFVGLYDEDAFDFEIEE